MTEAARVALDALIGPQFPNGGFPQGWDETPNPQPAPSQADYPHHDWRTAGRIKTKFTPDTRYISSAVFSQNIELLSRFLAMRRVEP